VVLKDFGQLERRIIVKESIVAARSIDRTSCRSKEEDERFARVVAQIVGSNFNFHFYLADIIDRRTTTVFKL